MGIPIVDLAEFGPPEKKSALYINLHDRVVALEYDGVQIDLKAVEPGLQVMLDRWIAEQTKVVVGAGELG